MPAARLEIHPAARAEIIAAEAWYAARSAAVAEDFLAELAAALDEIAEAPLAWPQYAADARRFVLRRFPFVMIFRTEPGVALVVAVAHTSRRPDYWRGR